VLTRHVLHMRKGRHAMWGHVSILLNYIKKRYLTVYSPCRPRAPANGCHAIGPHEANALRGGGLRGARAVRNLLTGRKSRV
jgi:hypothetical protein